MSHTFFFFFLTHDLYKDIKVLLINFVDDRTWERQIIRWMRIIFQNDFIRLER